MNKRWLIWLPLLGLGAWLVISAPDENSSPSAVVGSVERDPSRSAKAPVVAVSAKQPGPLERLIPRSKLFPKRPGKARRDLFASVSWLPPFEPVSEAPAPEAPPPAAFNYLGKQFDGQAWEVFLSLADRTYIARADALLDDRYKVESIDASSVTVVDLRTSQSQTISTGDQR
ncbi:MAG: hypothetical protein SXG53_22500 [Pseudomonadota bacterium]|nr:hypothetical protein [Pseudomonadota bacterium]